MAFVSRSLLFVVDLSLVNVLLSIGLVVGLPICTVAVLALGSASDVLHSPAKLLF